MTWCETCLNTGRISCGTCLGGQRKVTCPDCVGAGDQKALPCPHCHGTGKIIPKSCPACGNSLPCPDCQ